MTADADESVPARPRPQLPPLSESLRLAHEGALPLNCERLDQASWHHLYQLLKQTVKSAKLNPDVWEVSRE